MIALTNGTKHVVQESLDDIAESVKDFKATTLALAHRMAEDPSVGSTAQLRIVRGPYRHGASDVDDDPSTTEA